jgi:hypothetical protein
MTSELSALFRKRDLLALGIILLALYVTIDMHGFTYSIEPDWYIDQRKSRHSTVGNLPPIITDLDGNGENEIVVVTRDHYLKVRYSFPHARLIVSCLVGQSIYFYGVFLCFGTHVKDI